MMATVKNLAVALPLLAMFSIATCTVNTAGVSSETTNGATVAGMIARPSGAPYVSIAVDLRSANACAQCSTSAPQKSTITDNLGHYRF